MRILLLYDNFIRDYRGLLILKEYLNRMGHKVWIKATWDDPFNFASSLNIQAIVTGQIAEWSTHFTGEYCRTNNILLIINLSEPVTAEYNFDLLLTYNTKEFNDSLIDLQSIGIFPHYQHVISHKTIAEPNKKKYKFIGYPRTDISFDSELRNVETSKLSTKYNLEKYKKKYLFLSSFLLDGAFDGIPQQDLDRWNFTEFQQRTVELLAHTTKILNQFINEELSEKDVLIIKKHPWDCSSFFKENFASSKCLILDNNDFITPCMAVSDVIIHTYSTSAFEAWAMGKKTVSIYLEKYWSVAPVHMKKENVSYDYNSFLQLIRNLPTVSNYNDDKLFNGLMDGRATHRLAQQISALKPKKAVRFPLAYASIKIRIKHLYKYHLVNLGLYKYDVNAKAKKNTKMYDFLTWENERSNVNKLYKKTIRKFVSKTLN